jgi:hypothetical protein
MLVEHKNKKNIHSMSGFIKTKRAVDVNVSCILYGNENCVYQMAFKNSFVN